MGVTLKTHMYSLRRGTNAHSLARIFLRIATPLPNRDLGIDAIKIIWFKCSRGMYGTDAQSASCFARSITRIPNEPRVAYNPRARLFHIHECFENIPKQFRKDAVTVCTCFEPVPATEQNRLAYHPDYYDTQFPYINSSAPINQHFNLSFP